jgi:exosome complex RNA-binding protein Rrp42 (RNase PH superfamily)
LIIKDNAVPLIPKKDWWKIPVIVTANIVQPLSNFAKTKFVKVEKTIFFDASPSEILVTTNRYAIATLPLNSISEKQKVVFCESVGLTEGYAAAGRGIESSELQKMIIEAMKVGKEIIDAGDAEVERISR